MDRNEDENAHLFAVDVHAAELTARDLTPLDGVRAEFMRVVNGDPNIVIVRHTGRTGRAFDLYRLNLTTGDMVLHAQNPGDVCGWSVAGSSRVRMRFHCLPDGDTRLASSVVHHPPVTCCSR
jgi:hypothetical protein